MTIPDIYYNPFNRLSAHHRPIGANAQKGIPAGFAPNNSNSQVVAARPGQRGRLGHSGLILRMSSGDLFDKPHLHNSTTIAGATRTITWHGHNSGKNLPVTMRLPSGVGLEIFTDKGRDSNPSVFDVLSGVCSQFYAYEDIGPSAGLRNRYRLDGVDYPGQDAFDRGTSAISLRWPGTVLQWSDVSDSNPGPIRHTLNAACTYRNTGTANHITMRARCWPAFSIDGVRDDHASGDIPYGTLAFVPLAEFSTLVAEGGWTNRGYRMLECLRYYGIYVADGGGPGTRDGVQVPQMVIRKTDGFSTAVRNELDAALERIRPYLWPLMNGRGYGSENELWTDNNPYRGGGGPIDANSVNNAYDADSALPPPPQSAEAAMPTLITAGAWPIVAVP